MRIISEKNAILAALSFVEKYASKSRNIPILTHVLMAADDKGLALTTTNVEQGARDQIAVHVERAGSAAIPARPLLDAIKSVPTATEVLIDDDGQIATVLVGGKSRFKFPSLPASDLPVPPSLASEAKSVFMLDARALAKITKEVAFAVDEANGKYRCLGGISWQARDSGLQIAASDTSKLATITMPLIHPANMPDIVVPPIDLPAWTGDVEASVKDNFIRFRCGAQVVATQLLDAPFLDYRRVIPTEGAVLRFDREELSAAVSRARIGSDLASPSILFVGRDGVCSVSTAGVSGLAAEDSVQYEGEDFVFALTHRVIAPCLASMDCEIVEIGFTDHTSVLSIRDPKDADRLMVAFPYRDPRLAQYIFTPAEAAE